MDDENKIIKKVNKIDRAMAQEGMILTEEEKDVISDIYHGKKTYKEARREIIAKYKNNFEEPTLVKATEPFKPQSKESALKHVR